MQIRNTKKQLLLGCLVLLLTTAIRAQDDRGYIVKVGDAAPAGLSLTLQDGTTHQLSEWKGKVVLLQFTASWCSVCRKEMPHLEKDIWQAYKDQGLVMVGVDRDEPIDTVKKFSRVMNISYPLALDPGADIFGRFADKRAGVTRNVLIDRDGKIVFLTRLYDTKEFEALKQKVAALMKS